MLVGYSFVCLAVLACLSILLLCHCQLRDVATVVVVVAAVIVVVVIACYLSGLPAMFSIQCPKGPKQPLDKKLVKLCLVKNLNDGALWLSRGQKRGFCRAVVTTAQVPINKFRHWHA